MAPSAYGDNLEDGLPLPVPPRSERLAPKLAQLPVEQRIALAEAVARRNDNQRALKEAFTARKLLEKGRTEKAVLNRLKALERKAYDE